MMAMLWGVWVLGVLVAVAIVLAAIRLLFAREIRACFERDPAARHLLEVLLTCSGLHAIIVYRVAHAL